MLRLAAGAEWVSAPTEIKSAPAWAMAATVCRVIPGDFHQGTLFDECDGLPHEGGDILSSKIMSALPANASFTSCKVFASTSMRKPWGAPARQAAGSGHINARRAQDRKVVVLDEHAVTEREPMVLSTSQLYRPFFEGS